MYLSETVLLLKVITHCHKCLRSKKRSLCLYCNIIILILFICLAQIKLAEIACLGDCDFVFWVSFELALIVI